MGIILIIVCWILTPIFEVINFITVLCIKVRDYQYLKVVNKYFKSGSIDRDKFANHNYRTSLNFYFSKGGYEFGDKRETMSSAFGKKQLEKSLTITGWGVVYLLWFLDFKYWFKGGHCVNSIQV